MQLLLTLAVICFAICFFVLIILFVNKWMKNYLRFQILMTLAEKEKGLGDKFWELINDFDVMSEKQTKLVKSILGDLLSEGKIVAEKLNFGKINSLSKILRDCRLTDMGRSELIEVISKEKRPVIE